MTPEQRERKKEYDRGRYVNLSEEQKNERLEAKRHRRQLSLNDSLDDSLNETPDPEDESDCHYNEPPNGHTPTKRRKITDEQKQRRKEYDRARYARMSAEEKRARGTAARMRRLNLSTEDSTTLNDPIQRPQRI
ncbi:unnamed protein product, partial [Orchesella dallaii]